MRAGHDRKFDLSEGRQAEATPEYGLVFIRRETERRLLMTPRDPYDTAPQSFSPFL
jgi:hypothetical protein